MTIDANLLYGLEVGFAFGVVVSVLVAFLVFVAMGRSVRCLW
jgi:hypothetical protein